MHTTTDKARDWTRPPADPIPYRLRDRWADRSHGRRDGRAGLPVAGGDGADEPGVDRTPVDTPWLQALRQLTDDQMNAEVLSYHQEHAALTEMRGALVSTIDSLREQVHRAEAELAEADKEPDVTVRRLGDRRHPDYVATARRRAESSSRSKEAAERYFDACRRLGETVQMVATVEREIRRTHEVTNARNTRVLAHGCRRIAHYWTHVIRAHPHGAQVNSRHHPLEPDLPPLPEQDGEGKDT